MAEFTINRVPDGKGGFISQPVHVVGGDIGGGSGSSYQLSGILQGNITEPIITLSEVLNTTLDCDSVKISYAFQAVIQLAAENDGDNDYINNPDGVYVEIWLDGILVASEVASYTGFDNNQLKFNGVNGQNLIIKILKNSVYTYNDVTNYDGPEIFSYRIEKYTSGQ